MTLFNQRFIAFGFYHRNELVIQMPPSRRRGLIFATGFVLAASALVWRVRANDVAVVGVGVSAMMATERTIGETHVGRVDGENASWAPHRIALNGADFPEGVLALTWDDGPDRETLALAKYLHDAHIAATFFVVGEWVEGVSSEPGVGANRFETGYRKLGSGVLGEMTALGHRLGAHTENHALLTELAYEDAEKQLAECQKAIDPYVKNELRMFRAPGGEWNSGVAGATRSDFLASMKGPIRWDVDAKDWERSLYCRDAPANECEPSPALGATRMRAAAIAKRYVDAIEAASRRGIVLLHDRVGAVGTSYALDVARVLIPELVKRDYVFAAPVLEFSAMKARSEVASISSFAAVDDGGGGIALKLKGDINGDGRADSCVIDAAKREARCSLVDPKGRAKEATVWASSASSLPPNVVSAALIDITHDGRADLCVTVRDRAHEVICGLAP